MYYTILGTIIFGRDEQWEPEASIERHVATIVTADYEEACDIAEEMMDKHPDIDSYVIPNAFEGRIYNNTDQTLLLTESETIMPKSKYEWRTKK